MQLGFACKCEPKAKIDIRDINDSDVIFIGILSKVDSTTAQSTHLAFSISKMLKGNIDTTSVSYDIKGDKNHAGIFHNIDTVFAGQKWIIFSTSTQVNGETVHQLKKANSSNHCILSRPIIKNDPYLRYIKEVVKKRNHPNQKYYIGNDIFAEGSISNNSPVGVWKYYLGIDSNNYWEGTYIEGKREGLWQKKSINYLNEKVVISKEIYQSGILKERIEYNYIGEKRIHETFGEKLNRKTKYNKGAVFSEMVYHKDSDTTTIEYFKYGKSVNVIKREGKTF